MEIESSLSFDPLLSDSYKAKSSNPLLALANLVVAHNRIITRDGSQLPAAAAANSIALNELASKG